MRERLRDFLQFELFKAGDESVTVTSILLILLILVLTRWVAHLVRRTVAATFRRAGVEDEDAVLTYSNLAGTVIWFFGIVAALQQSGLNPTAVFAAGGFAAVAVGFASQDLIGNFVSGATLRLEGAIKPGDIIEVGGRMVKVRKMRSRATIARDLNAFDLVIPNAELAKSTVINYTLRDELFRLRTTVGVHYSSDMEVVRAVLEQLAERLPWRTPHPDPIVLLTEFAESSVDWEVSVWITDPWSHRRRRSQMNESIWQGLREAGIVIAFPQLDVHFGAEGPPSRGQEPDQD